MTNDDKCDNINCDNTIRVQELINLGKLKINLYLCKQCKIDLRGFFDNLTWQLGHV